VNNNLAIVVAT